MADTKERELAEQRYVELAHDYESNPIGSRDWVIFWNGWRERSELKATPLPADAALADAVALLRRTHQNHWPSIEIKAFLAKIDAMPDARLRALSQPEVAQVPAVPMAAIETVLHFCSPHEDASKEDCSKCSAAYEEVSNWRDALLSAAPSAKGGEG